MRSAGCVHTPRLPGPVRALPTHPPPGGRPVLAQPWLSVRSHVPGIPSAACAPVCAACGSHTARAGPAEVRPGCQAPCSLLPYLTRQRTRRRGRDRAGRHPSCWGKGGEREKEGLLLSRDEGVDPRPACLVRGVFAAYAPWERPGGLGWGWNWESACPASWCVCVRPPCHQGTAQRARVCMGRWVLGSRRAMLRSLRSVTAILEMRFHFKSRGCRGHILSCPTRDLHPRAPGSVPGAAFPSPGPAARRASSRASVPLDSPFCRAGRGAPVSHLPPPTPKQAPVRVRLPRGSSRARGEEWPLPGWRRPPRRLCSSSRVVSVTTFSCICRRRRLAGSPPRAVIGKGGLSGAGAGRWGRGLSCGCGSAPNTVFRGLGRCALWMACRARC